MHPPLLPILLALLLTGCGSKDWRQARRTDTADAYRAIANKPAHPKRARAAAITDRLDWEEAKAKNSSDGWQAYASHHPSSDRLTEARKNRDEARWLEVSRSDSRTVYEQFLATHPASPHAEEARVRADDLAFFEAETGGDAESYGRYLTRYRNGAHAEEATLRRQRLIWEETVQKDDPQGFTTYLKRFPKGENAEQARVALDGFKYSGIAVRIVSRKSLRDDSLKTYEKSLQTTLMEPLNKDLKLKVAWLPPVQVDGAYDALAALPAVTPADHAVLLIELEENKGAAFEPTGFATDITATVSLVPHGRMVPFQIRKVRSTSGDGLPMLDGALHRDAQERLGLAILGANFDLKAWKR